MRRRHDRSGPAERDRTAPLQRPARRTATPWVTVAAGAGAVTLVVAVAGMVGAATGGGEAVVVGGVSAEGGANGEDTVPAVTPRPDTPRPEVTRIPPPDAADGTSDDARPAPSPRPSASGQGEQAAPGAPSPTTEPAPAPTASEPTPAPTEPAPTPSPTTDPGTGSVSWVQERLRVHGADVAVTGTMDDATRTALRSFQKAHGLTPDGTVTAATAEALRAAPPDAEDPTGPGPTPPAEPAPTPSTDRPSVAVPGPSSSADEPAPTLAPAP